MRRPLADVLAALAVLAVPASSFAQPGVAPGAVPVQEVPAYAAPGATPMAAAPLAAPAAATAPVLVGVARRSAEDPAADRAYLARTALIAPRGTVTFQARAPIAPGAIGGLSAALTDRIELGVSGLLIADEEAVLGFNGKVQLVRGRRAALAATLDVFAPPDDNEKLYIPSLVASFCADGDACNTLVSLHLTGLGLDGEDEMPVFGGASFSMGKRNRLVGEFHITDNDSESVFAGYIGGRFGGPRMAFDAGIGFAGVAEDNTYDCGGDCYDDTGPDVIPYPFVGMSARL